MEKTVVAVDPGASKCGIALVKRDDEGKIHLLWRRVTPRDECIQKLLEARDVAPYSLVIVGAGTTSRDMCHQIREAMPSMGILTIDERDTTLQARERYWEHNKRRGWRRVFPATLQTPPEAIDDFAALILAERVLLV